MPELTRKPASATTGGELTDGAQTITGDKTFSGAIDAAGGFTGAGGLATSTTAGLVKTGGAGIKVHAGNGHGSTNNKIRRLSTIDTNYNTPGTAISYTDSATLGASFTVNEDGIYALSYSDGHNTTLASFGITLNSTELTTGIDTVSGGAILVASQTGDTTGSASNIGVTRTFSAGDVIRPHTSGTVNRTINSQVHFTITQVVKF